jgi:tetraacyldisaccharide 4'-kinase
LFEARLEPDREAIAALAGRRVLAFAGIGDPTRFFNTLRASGIDVAEQRAFADHHPYSQAEIESLIAEAKRDGLILVTTEKDLARLRDRAQQIVPFRVTLEFDDAPLLRKFVTDQLFKARERKPA